MAPVKTERTALLEPRLVGDVEGEFFVRDYQRGYRWGPDEVRRLLDDIKDAGSRNYFLQPVVVKRLEDDRWELVDGQQRLTTLYLVLHYIKRHMPTAEVRYTLTYETRPGSAAYLDSPTEAASLENIDYFHIYRPCRASRPGSASSRTRRSPRSSSFTALSKTVYLIWYEAPHTAEFDSRTLFTRLNVGRIPLTDAELVKALLLSRVERTGRDCCSVGQHRAGPARVRRCGVSRPARPTAEPTRISLLLDTIADTVAGAPAASASAALLHLRDAAAPDRGVAEGSVGQGRRPALAGPGLVRRPQPLPQDRLPRRGRRIVVRRTCRVGSGKHEVRVRQRTRRPHPRQPQPLQERCRVVDVWGREDGAGTPPDERGDGTPQNALLGALLVRRTCSAAVVPRAHSCPELARSQHRRAVDRVAARAPEGTGCLGPSRSRARRSDGADRRGAPDHLERDLRAATPRTHAAVYRR